jgi:transmembrane sensor
MNQEFRSKKEFANLLKKYREGQCSPEEETLVLRWYESNGRDSIFPFDEEELNIVEARIKSNLKKRLHINSEQDSDTSLIDPKRSAFWKVTAVAASLTILTLAIGFVYSYSSNKEVHLLSARHNSSVINNTSETAKEITLEDGTRINLQPNSSITFTKPFDPERREVTLEGEGFFRVTRDEKRPFIVYAGKVVTRVLGTSFNINANNRSKVTVSVKSGKVSVSKLEAGFLGIGKTLEHEVILTPNERAIYLKNDNSIEATLVESPEIVTSQEDAKVMRFENAPLSSIFTELARAYQVEIEFDEQLLKDCKLTTTLNNENLFNRLNIICKATGGTYSMEGTKIIIQNDGCSQP